MEWMRKNLGKIAFTLLCVAGVVIVYLALWRGRDTGRPSVPSTANVAAVQRDVQKSINAIKSRRASNDEHIKEVAETARHSVDSLDADAVVRELNALLDELRQRNAD